MFTGTTIEDLIATVERAEQRARVAQTSKPETVFGLSLVVSNAKANWENWAGVA